jgi:nucleoside-diphosphate-sugar epimerase
MKVFMTGASGWIGSAVARELLSEGHEVTGLARSERSEAALRAAGVEPLRGGLDDLDVLRAGAEPADAVIHLGFKHDFSDVAGAGRSERAAVEAFGDVLAGSGRALLVAAGIALIAPGRVVTEEDSSSHEGAAAPRGGSERLALDLAARDVRSVALRFAPTVHGTGDQGFVRVLVETARSRGVSGYIGDGSHHWPAVHRDDAARLVRLALDGAAAGSVVHAVAEEGVATRAIAEAIGEGLGVPVASVAPDAAAEHFGWIATFFGLDVRASSALTRERFGWTPTGPTLLDDLAETSYFEK